MPRVVPAQVCDVVFNDQPTVLLCLRRITKVKVHHGALVGWKRLDLLGQFETKDGFRGPCEMLVGAGTR